MFQHENIPNLSVCRPVFIQHENSPKSLRDHSQQWSAVEAQAHKLNLKRLSVKYNNQSMNHCHQIAGAVCPVPPSFSGVATGCSYLFRPVSHIAHRSSSSSFPQPAPPIPTRRRCALPRPEAMIILDDERHPPQGPKAHDRAAGVTLRFPERAVGRANVNASALTLPDYETSQALAQDDDEGYKKPGKRMVESRCVAPELWRHLAG